MQAVGTNGSTRFTFTLDNSQKDWLTETATPYTSQGDIVRTAIQLLMDLGWKPDEN